MQTRPINVAIVDDDPLFLDHVSLLLTHEGGMRVTKASDGDQLLRDLDPDAVECVVVDYSLGTENGLGLAERIKARFEAPPPIVLLTAAGGETTAVKAFRLGLSDYVSKRNMKTSELVGAIRGAVDRHQRSQSTKAELEFHKQHSAYDGSTGLYSPTYLTDYLGKITAAPGEPKPFALIAVRMAGAAHIRKTFGHLVADRALRAFGRRVQSSSREGDICGRYTEDSFLCLLDVSGTTDVAGLSRQRVDRLEHLLNFEADFDNIRLQLSPAIGVATFPEDGTDLPALLAHSAVFAAPDAGPARPEVAEGDRAAPIVAGREKRRNGRRHRVLKRGKIYVDGMNSIVDCSVRNLSRCGALLRVNSFFVPPDRFDLTILGSSGRLAVSTRWQSGNDFGVEFREAQDELVNFGD